MPCSAAFALCGEVKINGELATENNRRQAYVQQEDVFYSQLTVYEAGGHASGLHGR